MPVVQTAVRKPRPYAWSPLWCDTSLWVRIPWKVWWQLSLTDEPDKSICVLPSVPLQVYVELHLTPSRRRLRAGTKPFSIPRYGVKSPILVSALIPPTVYSGFVWVFLALYC